MANSSINLMPCPELVPGVNAAVDAGSGIHVVSIDDERPAYVFDFCERSQRHHFTEIVSDLQAAHVVGSHAIGDVGLGVHLPGAARID